MMGPGRLAALPLRALKELVKCPVDAALIYFCAKVLQRVHLSSRRGESLS